MNHGPQEPDRHPGEHRQAGAHATALGALRAAGLRVHLRKPPTEQELDLEASRADAARADRALIQAGFHRFRVRGHGSHRFYLTFREGQWFKVDLKLADGFRSPFLSVGRRLVRRLPTELRRRSPVVALVGPDGAGKTTVITTLRRAIPVGVTVVYLGGRRPIAPHEESEEAGQPSLLRETAFVVVKLLRLAVRLAAGYAAARRGHLVLCDRHPLEILALRPRRRPPARVLERLLVRLLFPWPDALVILDVPGTDLYRRKGEHSPQRLETWRQALLEVLGPRGVVISATSPPDQVAARVSGVVWEALSSRRGWS